MPELTLEIPGHLELHVGTRSGRVSITGEDRQDLYIESDAPIREEKIRVDATGRVSLKSSRGGSGWLKLRVPMGADLKIGTVSGSVELHGQVGRARVTTVSGKIDVERAEALDARSISGTITVGDCTGRCRTRRQRRRVAGNTAGTAKAPQTPGGMQWVYAMGTRHRFSTQALLAQAGWVRELAARLVSDPHLVDDVVQATLAVRLAAAARDRPASARLAGHRGAQPRASGPAHRCPPPGPRSPGRAHRAAALDPGDGGASLDPP